MPVTWLLIGFGGALGTLLRYGLSLLAGAWFGAALPWGTLLANVLGSFALGVVMELGGGRAILGTDLRLVLGVGVFGGFTTYSSFNLEILRFAEEEMLGRAAVYALTTTALCLGSGLLGLAVARILARS
jgi:CrcB protein